MEYGFNSIYFCSKMLILCVKNSMYVTAMQQINRNRLDLIYFGWTFFHESYINYPENNSMSDNENIVKSECLTKIYTLLS